METQSFLREAELSYLQHLTAGIAALPAGLVYGLLAWNHKDRPEYVLLVLCFGLGSAIFATALFNRWLWARSFHFPGRVRQSGTRVQRPAHKVGL